MTLIKFQRTAPLLKGIVKLKDHRLVTNAGIYVLGNTLQKALLFLLIPVYTRFLSTEDYGVIGLTQMAGVILVIILNFGIQDGLIRYYYDFQNSPDRLKQFITTNFLFLVVTAGSVVLVLHFGGEWLWLGLTSGSVPFSPYLQLVLWSSLASVLFQIPLQLYRVQQKASAYMLAQTASFVLSLGATLLFVVGWRMGALGQLLGTLVAMGAMGLVFSTLLLKEWYNPRLRWSDISMSLAYGLPLIPHSLSAWAMTFIDRLLLESRVPLSELGLYTLGYQLGVGMLVLVSSINMAWAPYYYNLMTRQADTERVVRQVSSLYVAIIGGICLAAVLFSREIVLLLAPPAYLAAARYTPLILCSYLLEGYYYFASMPLFFYKKTRWIPLITFNAALLNIVLNLWWIPRWGALGSAWATFLAFLVALIIAYILSRRWQQVNYPLFKFAIANGLILIGVLLATYPLPEVRYLTELVWKFALLAGFAVFAYFWLVKPNLNLLGRGS